MGQIKYLQKNQVRESNIHCYSIFAYRENAGKPNERSARKAMVDFDRLTILYHSELQSILLLHQLNLHQDGCTYAASYLSHMI